MEYCPHCGAPYDESVLLPVRRSAAIRRWSAGCSCDTDRSDTRVGLWQHGGAATGSIASESI